MKYGTKRTGKHFTLGIRKLGANSQLCGIENIQNGKKLTTKDIFCPIRKTRGAKRI